MKKLKFCILASVLFLVVSAASYAGPTTYSGITFPDGDISFADAVYFYAPGTNVGPNYNDPDAAIGTPDYSGNNFTAASLGIGGSLILQFTDNSLTTSGDSAADLHIFEIGGAVELMNIAISTDAVTWIDLGDLMGQPTSIDIDAVAGVTPGTKYSFVRINDISPNQSGYPYGEADIDAVGAISSAPPAVPVPGAFLLGGIGTGLVGWLRKRRTI